jgi:hypothetical protein
MVASELRLGFTDGCHDRRNRDVKSYREGPINGQAAFARRLDPMRAWMSEDAAPG